MQLRDSTDSQALIVVVVNRGLRPIRIVDAAIEAAGGLRVPLSRRYGEQPFPIDLRSGEAHIQYLESDTAMAVMEGGGAQGAGRFVFRDSRGRVFASGFVDPRSGRKVSRRSPRSVPRIQIERSA